MPFIIYNGLVRSETGTDSVAKGSEPVSASGVPIRTPQAQSAIAGLSTSAVRVSVACWAHVGSQMCRCRYQKHPLNMMPRMEREEKRPDQLTSCRPATDRRAFTRAQWDDAIAFLCKVWVYEHLKPEQELALEYAFTGQDFLALLPTGYLYFYVVKRHSVADAITKQVREDCRRNRPRGHLRLPFQRRPFDPSRRRPKSGGKMFRPFMWIISPLTQLILNHVRDFNQKVGATCPG